ncbi:MAG: glycosyltransferase family 4 protein [Cetobacterium sp.]|uniref:glycosyltransferase family 4 protein n=1 Tax=Cetobacterium sp. TaxID=2071632 RepID=UPI002FC91807
MKKVIFILPSGSARPVGGHKVVFEYTNKLIEDGFKVGIVMPAALKWKEISFLKKMIGILRYVYFKFKKNRYLPYSWFDLNKKANIFWCLNLSEKNIPEADYIFATACETAEYVADYEKDKGEKFYLIQSHENWAMDEKRLHATYKKPMKKIVISKFLKNLIDEYDKNSMYIENGLDNTKFYKLKDIKKDKNTIMMLYHFDEKVKQSKKALSILKKLKENHNELKLILFGLPERPKDLDEWIEYYKMPKQELLVQLYNRARIFVSPSYIEGWALPPAEAMLSGTCVCVTDIPGHEYVEHLKTGYKVDKSLENLYEGIEFLLDNQNIVDRLEKNGQNYISNFNWENSYRKFKKYILN